MNVYKIPGIKSIDLKKIKRLEEENICIQILLTNRYD